MERVLFKALGAAITRIDGKNQCQIAAVLDSSQSIDMSDQTRWLPIDLDLTPGRSAALWSNVTFDDRGVRWDAATGTLVPLPTVMTPKDITGHGITSLGPIKDIPRAQYYGGVYVSEAYFAKYLARIKDPQGIYDWLPAGWFDYELHSLAYSTAAANDKRAGQRYVGCHVRLDAITGSFATVSVTSPTKNPRQDLGQYTLNLSDPNDCDDAAPVTAPHRLIAVGDAPGTEGALFVNLGRAARSNMRGPKIPVGFGV